MYSQGLARRGEGPPLARRYFRICAILMFVHAQPVSACVGHLLLLAFGRGKIGSYMLVAEIGSYFIDPKSQDYGSYRVVPLYGS